MTRAVPDARLREDLFGYLGIDCYQVVHHGYGGISGGFAGLYPYDAGGLRRHMAADTVAHDESKILVSCNFAKIMVVGGMASLAAPGVGRVVMVVARMRVMTGRAVHVALHKAFTGSPQGHLIAVHIGGAVADVCGYGKMGQRVAGLETKQGSKGDVMVEDNREILDLISRELQSEYIVRRALNGKQAMDIARGENIQLIISDIMMPVMDGIDLCKALKTNLEYSHIPVILLTARNTLHSRIEGPEVGADAYIEKPFVLEHLKAQISNLLSNRAKIKEYFASSPMVHIKSMAYSKADKQFLERLDAIIKENLGSMDVDVENLARLMNMSRATFHRKVKALSNLTPHELVNITRLQEAARLLAEGNYKVYEVADIVGYTLQSNFARDFHKQFGMTPSDYVNGWKKPSGV